MVEQVTAVLRYGPLTRAQLNVRLRHNSTKSVSEAIQRARQSGLIELRPDEGWALVADGTT